jgi:glycosyltransferase involved in cell wall biosynthesis
MAKRADAVMVYDTEMGDSIRDYFIREFGFGRNQIYQVTNGIDTNVITNLQNGEKQYEAVMIGGLRPNKGLYDIIPIWKKVVAAMNHAKLVIVGGSSYAEWFEQAIKNGGLDSNIILLGNRPHKEALSIMKRARIYITPSREEGWGIAVCEALASKLPVVAYNLPEYKRTFGESIVTVPLGNIDKFSEQVISILTNPLDYTTYITNGFKIAVKYDWNNVAEAEFEIVRMISFHNL